jgi:ribosome-associated heat shock protein Hsp15
MHSNQQERDGVRLDLWLWAARFYKTRSLAKQAIETGKVDIDGQRAKAARSVRIGDALRIAAARNTSKSRYAVSAKSAARPASHSRFTRRAKRRAPVARPHAPTRAAERAGYQAPDTKPDKRARN